jgi:DNA repair protein RadD
MKDVQMFAPRYYQLEAVQAVYRFWEKGYANGNPVVVAPTGSGKSIIIALLMHQAVQAFPGTRIMCLADVKELIEQDSDAFRTVAPHTPFGIYSALIGSARCRAGLSRYWSRWTIRRRHTHYDGNHCN